ncbi:MerR family transcriptional regulator [Nocardiopsis alba]|uniref:MerR family transcriptional regulator n=1 Tax=Nocardiopsis alba TaxID=53437 RepID=UPI003400EC0F
MDEPPRLRPIDLARAAGISTQQVRNHADEGLLPPTERTESGYRVFTPRHRRALLTFRALYAACGSDVSRRIMHALNDDDLPTALALLDSSHAELHHQRLALDETAKALTAIADRDTGAPAPPTGDLRIGEVAAHLGVRTSTLRVWEQAGLLDPARERVTGHRLYTPTDVRLARIVRLLRQVHYPLPDIGPILRELGRTGDSGSLHVALGRRAHDLDRRSRALLTAAAHLHDHLDRP